MANGKEINSEKVSMSMNGTFPLKCGITLTLKAVRRDAVMPILLRMGRLDIFDDEARFKKYVNNLPTRARDDMVSAFYQLFNYCVGWGVVNDPDDNALDDLTSLGFRSSTPKLARVNWVRYLLIDDDEEAGELAGAVLMYSVDSWGEKEEEVKTEPEVDQSELEMLRAKVAELESAKLEVGVELEIAKVKELESVIE